MSSLRSIAIFYLFFISSLVASPLQDSRPSTSVLVEVTNGVHEPQSSFPSFPSRNISRNPPALLRKSQELKLWRARPLGAIVPIQIAAPLLEQFYQSIATQVNEQWSSHPAMTNIWIKWGALDLVFRSPGEPIPWSLVARVAQKMLTATRLGWVGTYELLYLNDQASQSVGVILQMGTQQTGVEAGSLPSIRHRSLKARTATTTALVKRSDFALTFYKIYGAILPISLAAQSARIFFDAVNFHARYSWFLKEPSALFTVTGGPFQLSVSCLGSTVPWPIVANVAHDLSIMASRGLVNNFDAYYTDPGTLITIAISLRLTKEISGRMPPRFISPRMKRSIQQDKLPATLPKPLVTTRSPTGKGKSIKVTKFTSITALVPTALIASRFEDFYNILALRIETGQYAHLLPSKEVTLSIWDFELSFSCSQMNVPWGFIISFIIDMADMSSRSWTGFYEAMFKGDRPLGEVIIHIAMKLKEKGK
ncbi:hypothetical protein MMC28_002433 [Mycoblastus sanguinarius]|nr:hypothetical protein [Mycoblastus sanguinarius]